jgi:hypothetical protein
VHEVDLVPIGEAVERLDASGRSPVAAAYVRGELPPGSVVLQLVHADGLVEDFTAPGATK